MDEMESVHGTMQILIVRRAPASYRLQLAEDFFDALATFLARRIADVAVRAPFAIRWPLRLAAVVSSLGNSRGDAVLPKFDDEAGVVERFVPGERAALADVRVGEIACDQVLQHP